MTLSTAYNLDRQAILDRVHAHFIVNREPAGCEEGATCVFHGENAYCEAVACAIGIFDPECHLGDSVREHAVVDLAPDRLEIVFGQELTIADINFLSGVQCEHDMAVRYAAPRREDFDNYFVENLIQRLDRFASEQDLQSPCTPVELAYTA